jgi:hypothetical protein
VTRKVALAVTVVVLIAGCAGSDDESRHLAGGTFPQELGLSLVVDDVEVGGEETHVSVLLRNESARKLLVDPYSSVLVVDGESHLLDRSEFPTLIPDVGAGGGEASGVLVFPAVDADADRYELIVKGTSENAVAGDGGNVAWTVVLEPVDDR